MPGLADWWCHRGTDMEHSAGLTVSVIHAAMMTEGEVPPLFGLCCEANAGMLTVTYATLLLHELTAVWDVPTRTGGGR